MSPLAHVTRVVAAGIGALLLGVVGVLTAPAAYAAEELGLSWDGREWSDRLVGPVLPQDGAWVPGEERAGRFHARNRTDDPARLRVRLESDGRPTAFSGRYLHADLRVGAGEWRRVLPRAREGAAVPVTLPPGEDVPVRLRVRFDADAPNRTQRQTVDLTVVLTLTGDQDAGAGTDPRPDPGQDRGQDGLLPGTGAPPVAGLAIAGAVLIGTGIAVLRRRREGSHA